ncbi:TolC family protein [Variovorax sp. KK3]|uniref:TolC family protein n=1 Tax=Variovorax sp. KK3 TaxID=1855728 RepID=UPI0009FAB44D|nr:TolC family protein [Variovorax sp. KK3]
MPFPRPATDRRTPRRPGTVAVAAAIAALLAGCSVTPEPLSQEALTVRVNRNLASLTTGQEPVGKEITLYEAMARALKYNLDYKVAMMEEAVRSRELDRARYDMLPQLVANAGYSSRDNDSGASSRSLLTGRQSLEPSTSSERQTTGADLSLSWDVLDFGVSYARARQQSDQTLISLENRRKVANRMVEDVRTAYWRAVSAERLITRLSQLAGEVTTALDDSQELARRRNTSPLAALTYQRDLIDVERQIQSLQRELVIAKGQLAALMNLEPGTPFKLALPQRNALSTDFCMSGEGMMKAALANRPELREVAYRLRINEQDGTVALLRNLPSLRAFIGTNYDSNDFLYNNHWSGVGVRASWNLMSIFRYPADKRVIEAQTEWLGERERALTMAVMTQVHVSRAQFAFARQSLLTAARYSQVQTGINDQVQSAFKARQEGRQRLIREEMNGLLAEVRYDLAYADMQNAFANVYSSVGLDSFTPDVSSSDAVPVLSDKLQKLWLSRQDLSGATSATACTASS